MRTFSTVLKARCARRAPVAADPRTAPRAEGPGPAAAQLPGRTGGYQGRGLSPRVGAAHRLRPSGPQRRRLTPQTQPGRRGQDHADLRRCPPHELARKSHPPGTPVSNRARSRSRARRRRVARNAAKLRAGGGCRGGWAGCVEGVGAVAGAGEEAELGPFAELGVDVAGLDVEELGEFAAAPVA